VGRKIKQPTKGATENSQKNRSIFKISFTGCKDFSMFHSPPFLPTRMLLQMLLRIPSKGRTSLDLQVPVILIYLSSLLVIFPQPRLTFALLQSFSERARISRTCDVQDRIFRKQFLPRGRACPSARLRYHPSDFWRS